MIMGNSCPEEGGQSKYCEMERLHREAVFAILNKAFDRNYGEKDILKMQSKGVVYVKSDKIRRYDFIPVAREFGTRMACLTESDVAEDSNISNVICNGETIWIEMCNVALIRPTSFVKPAMEATKCVINTPGGVIDYKVNVVTVDENDYGFYSLHKRLSEETMASGGKLMKE